MRIEKCIYSRRIDPVTYTCKRGVCPYTGVPGRHYCDHTKPEEMRRLERMSTDRMQAWLENLRLPVVPPFKDDIHKASIDWRKEHKNVFRWIHNGESIAEIGRRLGCSFEVAARYIHKYEGEYQLNLKSWESSRR